jgi:hypothetical protein
MGSRLGLLGGPTTARSSAAAPAPVVSLAFVLQVAGVPQVFSDSPQAEDSNRIAVGNQGFQIVVRIVDANGNPVDVSASLVQTIVVVWPNGALNAMPAQFLTNGTDGRIAVLVPDGLPPYGLYGVRGFCKFSNQIVTTRDGRLWVGE